MDFQNILFHSFKLHNVDGWEHGEQEHEDVWRWEEKKNAKNVNVEFESWLAKSNNIQHIY